MSESPQTDERQSTLSLVLEAVRGSDRDFARLDLRRAIPLLAIPMVFEMAMEAIFAIVDVFFVSRLGPAAIATVGLTESVITIVYALGVGVAMSVTAMVSRRWGEGKRDEAAMVGGQAMMVGLGIGLVLGVPAPWFAADILRMMGAEPDVVEMGSGFTAVALAANPVIMLLFILNAIFRGGGDAASAMRALWIANGVNLILDPCLIFGLGPFPELGVMGAAVATTIGRSLGVVYQLRVLWTGPRVRLTAACLRPRLSVIVDILRVSVGGVGQYLIGTASWIALVRILAEFGSDVVAGYTVAMRIVIFALLPSWGFANATATLVGQSLGADDPRRAERAVLYSGLYNMVFLGLISAIFIAIPDAVTGLLAEEAEVQRWASRALFIISFGYMFYAWEMVLLNAFNGAGDTRTPSLINLVCFWAVEIPLGYWLAYEGGWGPDGVFVAVAFAYSLAAVVAFVAFRRGGWKNVTL
ncbi:MAG: MATE family efflux transporter [Myxococcota bacterium]